MSKYVIMKFVVFSISSIFPNFAAVNRSESVSALFFPQRLFYAADRMSNLVMPNHIVVD